MTVIILENREYSLGFFIYLFQRFLTIYTYIYKYKYIYKEVPSFFYYFIFLFYNFQVLKKIKCLHKQVGFIIYFICTWCREKHIYETDYQRRNLSQKTILLVK